MMREEARGAETSSQWEARHSSAERQGGEGELCVDGRNGRARAESRRLLRVEHCCDPLDGSCGNKMPYLERAQVLAPSDL